ncbi:MAG: hypothetical protein WCV41_02730 [Patescibacteria group bacterium]
MDTTETKPQKKQERPPFDQISLPDPDLFLEEGRAYLRENKEFMKTLLTLDANAEKRDRQKKSI